VSTKTTNFELLKPGSGDVITASDLSKNFDTIDGTMKKISWSTVTVATTAWDSSSKTASIAVNGVAENNAVDVSWEPTASNWTACKNAGVRATAQTAGTLTLTCDTVPTAAVSLNVKVTG
jgi:hypothetical protein